MMLLKMKSIVGLVLCTLILSASVPMLLGIQATPETLFGGDMVAVSQVNSSAKLNVSMLDTIKQEPNVVSASAEITCFTVVNGQPVLVRGVILDDFLEVAGGGISSGAVADNARFAVMGRKMAERTGLGVGDRVLLTGSSNPAMFQLEVDAVYEGRHSEDELLVPLSYARKMAGLGADAVLFIRVKTTNQSALMETLEQQEQPVMFTTPGGPSIPINAQISEEERAMQHLAIKYLDTSQFKATNGTYVGIFVQEGASSIRVVIMTFIILDCALAFIGSAAIVSRAIIERRREIGIISAVGAGRKYIRGLIMKDVLIMSVAASLIGLAVGLLTIWVVEEYALLRMFGESIRAVVTPQIVFWIFLGSVLIHLLSGLAVESMFARVKPRELLQDTETPQREADAPPLSRLLGAET